MSESAICSESSLVYAKRLVESIESGDDSEAIKSLERLSAIRESDLFQELGKLTRQLHDTLTGFELDSKISLMTEKDIPDAKERLNYVINMTEQAADRTLNAVEGSIPLSENLKEQSVKLQDSWERFKSRDMGVEEFKSLSEEIADFFNWLNEKAPELHGNLSDIMMAQDFQDLTGQIIRRVITLVQDVESSLVDLIRLTGQKINAKADAESADGPDISPSGPVVPGVDSGDVVAGQDDVDELLSSLGF